MKRFFCTSLAVAVLGLPMGFGLTGCDKDNSGGNEGGVMDNTSGKTTVDPKAPKTEDEYIQQHKKK